MAKQPVIASDSERESLMPQGLPVPQLPSPRNHRSNMADHSSTLNNQDPPSYSQVSSSTSTPQPIETPPPGGSDSSHLGDSNSNTVLTDKGLHRSQSESSGMQTDPSHDGHHGTDMGLVSHKLQSTGSDVDPPVITYDEVVTTPSTPTGTRTHDLEQHGLFHLSNPVENKGTGMTPAGSLLAVNKPIQLRESTLTINYPDSELGKTNWFGYIEDIIV